MGLNGNGDLLALFNAYAQAGGLDERFRPLQPGYLVQLRLAGVELRDELQSPLPLSPPSAYQMRG